MGGRGGGGRGGVKAGVAAEGMGSDFPAPGEPWSVTRRPVLDRGRLWRPPLRTQWHLEPTAPPPRRPASCGTGDRGCGRGGGGGEHQQPAIRVSGGARLASCEAWMGSSCRLSPPVSTILASAALSWLGRSCLTPLPKPAVPSPPRQRPALLHCALQVVPGILMTCSVPPRVTACHCHVPSVLGQAPAPYTSGNELPLS